MAFGDASMEDKIFGCAMAVSFLAHAIALGSLLFADVSYTRKIPKEVEVVYQVQALKPKVVKKKPKVKSVKQAKRLPVPEILEKAGRGPSPMMKDIVKQAAKLKVHEKKFSHMSSPDGKRHVSVPLLKSEKITNPQYVNYHELIRSKIRNRAYFYIDSPEFQSGEVYLTFVISSQGVLEDLKIIESKTSANRYLKQMKSINE